MSPVQNGARCRPCLSRGTRSAFTIMELLVVIGIVIVLLSIVVVAVNAAMRTSQKTNTQSLMSAINQGLVQFQSDIGYLPPVLGEEPPVGSPELHRGYFQIPAEPVFDPSGTGLTTYIDELQQWFSYTTIAEYLLGYGHALQDGYGRVPGGGFPENDDDGPLGIRHPGRDGYWGRSPSVAGVIWDGELSDREDYLANSGSRYRQGQVYGPYLELSDPQLLAAIVGSNPDGSPQLAFPGEAGYPPDTGSEPRTLTIVDYWGEPIRYYRKPYVNGNPAQEYRPFGGSTHASSAELRVPTLSDVFVLRPYRLGSEAAMDVGGTATDIALAAQDAAGDATTTHALHSAKFALLSSGPDRRVDPDYRADPEEYNRDNIVELGR